MPPHLTLKPSKKQNKKIKKKGKRNTKNRNRNNNIQPQDKTKQTNRNKTNTKKKTKNKKHKNTQTFQTQINEKKPLQKSPKNWENEKTSIFNTFGTMADTQKTNHNNIKTSKQQTPKNTFLPCSKTTHYFFINFCFCHHTAFVFEKLGFGETL